MSAPIPGIRMPPDSAKVGIVGFIFRNDVLLPRILTNETKPFKETTIVQTATYNKEIMFEKTSPVLRKLSVLTNSAVQKEI